MYRQRWFNLVILAILAIACLFLREQQREISDLRQTVRTLMDSVDTLQQLEKEKRGIEPDSDHDYAERHFYGEYRVEYIELFEEASRNTGTDIWLGPSEDSGWICLYSTETNLSSFWEEVERLRPQFFKEEDKPLGPKA